MLLRAVMQVALDRATGLVAGGDDTTSRTLQLVGLTAHLVERRLQRGVEPGVVHRHPELARELDDRALLLRRERSAPTRALHQQEPEELAGVRHRCGADERVLATGQQIRQPHLHPAVADQASLHDGSGFEAAHRDRRCVRPGGRRSTAAARRRRGSTVRRGAAPASPAALRRPGGPARPTGSRGSCASRTCERDRPNPTSGRTRHGARRG